MSDEHISDGQSDEWKAGYKVLKFGEIEIRQSQVDGEFDLWVGDQLRERLVGWSFQRTENGGWLHTEAKPRCNP